MGEARKTGSSLAVLGLEATPAATDGRINGVMGMITSS